jgi:catechol 2,3-dioxygenase-like lactoylglutathione lyase family enzyme
MSTLGLAHINFHGDRAMLDALKDFYCDAVGLEVGPRPAFARFGYWLYAGGEPIVHLFESAPDEVRSLTVPSAFDHIAFNCRDSDAVEAQLRRKGVDYRKTVVPGTSQVQLFLTDPAHNKVELNFAA